MGGPGRSSTPTRVAGQPPPIYLSIRMNGSTLSDSHSVFDAMAALGDSTRARLLALVEAHELTVGELCTVVQLPQSTVSRHLKVLADHDLVASRADGTSRRYRATLGGDPA